MITHITAVAGGLLPLQDFPIPKPTPQAPPAIKKAIDTVLGILAYGAAAAIIGMALTGFILAGIGRYGSHRDSGHNGARLILTSLFMAVLYGIIYGLLQMAVGMGA